MTRKLPVVLGKLIDRGREELNKEECHSWQGMGTIHSYAGQPGSQSAIILRTEHVVAVQAKLNHRFKNKINKPLV